MRSSCKCAMLSPATLQSDSLDGAYRWFVAHESAHKFNTIVMNNADFLVLLLCAVFIPGNATLLKMITFGFGGLNNSALEIGQGTASIEQLTDVRVLRVQSALNSTAIGAVTYFASPLELVNQSVVWFSFLIADLAFSPSRKRNGCFLVEGRPLFDEHGIIGDTQVIGASSAFNHSWFANTQSGASSLSSQPGAVATGSVLPLLVVVRVQKVIDSAANISVCAFADSDRRSEAMFAGRSVSVVTATALGDFAKMQNVVFLGTNISFVEFRLGDTFADVTMPLTPLTTEAGITLEISNPATATIAKATISTNSGDFAVLTTTNTAAARPTDFTAISTPSTAAANTTTSVPIDSAIIGAAVAGGIGLVCIVLFCIVLVLLRRRRASASFPPTDGVGRAQLTNDHTSAPPPAIYDKIGGIKANVYDSAHSPL
jgi:hypothetical protein